MKKKHKTTEQIIRILREADTGLSVEDICRKHGMSAQTGSVQKIPLFVFW